MDDESQEEDFLFKKNVLALRLQQRRPRKVLADQGIIPPLKSPGAYFPQVQRLERARKEDYLNHAMQMRPNRDMLVRQHILEDTSACNSIVANQKDLKKAQLVDDLNDKIAFRPGVIELVERNIIPATDDVQEAIKGGHFQYKKIADFTDEDSSGDALSPEQQIPLSATPPPFQLSSASTPYSAAAQSSPVYSTKSDAFNAAKSSIASALFTQSNTHPYLSRQTSKGSKIGQGGLIPKIVNARKKKDKPKIKKLKYHQYVPPDQQGKSAEKKASASNDDTPYSRLLEQQQLYLQFQIMNNQVNTQGLGDPQQQPTFGQQRMVSPPPPPPLTQAMKVDKPHNRNTPLTQSKLDDMKVSELKEELKLRGKKVTGTKEVLVDRLKPFCLPSDSVFTSNIDESSSNFSMGGSAMLPDGRMVTERYPMHQRPAQMLNVNPGSGNSVQGNFPIDPNSAHSHKVALMPAPERHEVTVKQEKVTLPTWHHAPETRGAQPPMAPNQTAPFMNEDSSKDKLLERQQKQINDLKRMVELHRSQLQHMHNHKPATRETVQVMTKPAEAARVSSASFQFPASSNTNQLPARQQPTSNQVQPVPAPRRQNPPKYEQACEMMKDAKSQGEDVDALLELLKDTGELPSTPVVTRVLLNDHESYHGINNRPANPHQEGYPQHSDYVPQEQLQLRRDVHQNQVNRHSQEFPNNRRSQEFPSNRHSQEFPNNRRSQEFPNNRHSQEFPNNRRSQEFPNNRRSQEFPNNRRSQEFPSNRHSQEFPSNAPLPTQYPAQPGRADLAQMLVDSAGDALMDTSNFPPAAHRYSNPSLDQQIAEYSRGSARNSIDSGVMYSTPHFSPMDTSNMESGSLRLSSSSIDSIEPTLNAVSLSPATPPRLKHHHSSHPYRQRSSQRPIHHNLVKSASQELLSTNQNPPANNNPMNNGLGWLDLTLGSAVGGPPSPGNPFEIMGRDGRTVHHYQHSNPVSIHGSHDADLNLYAGDSSGNLNCQPNQNNVDPQAWDPWGDLLSSTFNSS